ncbi:MAG: hypothetical protein ACJ8EL_22445, partial [Rhizomicrobium sp.]
LPKRPGIQKLTPPSSANADWEKNMIAGATIAATPSLRRCAEIGRPLFAVASAILAAIIISRKVCRFPIKSGDIVTSEQPGFTLQSQSAFIFQKKD